MVSGIRGLVRAYLVGPAVVLGGLAIGSPAAASCASWRPVTTTSRYSARAVTAQDLIELVNFGRPDAESVGGPSPLGVSPDGRLVAVVLQRAELSTNGFCQAVVLIDRSGRNPPRVLDRGGEFLMTVYAAFGRYTKNGFPLLNAARFSPDGRWIAYLKRVGGRTQLWGVKLDGRPAAMLSHAPADVTSWAWSADRAALTYGFAQGREAAEAAIALEGRSGWHYDDRMSPMAGLRPQIVAPLPEDDVTLDPETGALGSALARDRALVSRGGFEPVTGPRPGGHGTTASLVPLAPTGFAPLRLKVTGSNNVPITCGVAACIGHLTGLWWGSGGRTLTFQRTEGWNDRFSALYRWSPGRGQPRRLLETDDLVEGCVPAGQELLCLRQGATQPPRLVAFDVWSGRQRVLFDPNPGFRRLTLGSVQRLEWRNTGGREAYGDLVLPPGYKGGRLPVVVVLYRSRGFLRGGTGNDYPIQLFALRGFAVLSIDRPALYAAGDLSIRSVDAFWRANFHDWADRRSVDSALHAGLDLLVARGVADPHKLALTGLSDGASTVRFALVNSRRFAAAAISTCCVDESADEVVGPAWEQSSLATGSPKAAPIDIAFWRPYSLALNADRMDTPILMQLADSELLTGVHAFTALRSYGQPVDLYFYPDEYHIKWQPEHRRAVYERDLDWFSFWLQGHEDPAPDKAKEYARWRAFRATRSASRATPAP